MNDDWTAYDTDAAIDRLIAAHTEKARQAKERPTLQGWFAGKLMREFDGSGDYGSLCQQVAARLSRLPTP